MRKTVYFLAICGFLAAGWWWWRGGEVGSVAVGDGSRKLLFYQSPMHPWIRSDQPGDCTICGMKLVAVYAGSAGKDLGDGTESEGVVRLSGRTVKTMEVETSVIGKRPLERLIRVAGRMEDDESAHRRISAYVEGRIDKLFVNYVGAEVSAGEPLASIFSRELLVARGEYLQALERKGLLEKESSIAGSRQKLRRFGLTLGQIEKMPGQSGDTFDLVSPISGTVVERKVYEGQYVKEGEGLFEIADFSKMWFVFDVYERDLGWVRMGQEVEVKSPSVPGKVYRAPITFIDPNVDGETRAAKVRVVLDNPIVDDPGKHRHELLHKVFAEGRIRVKTESVLAVPRSAVLSPGGEARVYLRIGEGEYRARRVILGRVSDAFWEVLGGLKEGDEVVTTGNLLIDGQAQLADPGRSLGMGGKAEKALSVVEREGAGRLFVAASVVGGALAADNLAEYQAGVEELRGALGAVKFGGGEVGVAKDLVEARKEFYLPSLWVAELALRARKEGEEKWGVKIYECPMAKSAVPSAETNRGLWVQVKGPMGNPFFGAEMLNCGKEITR